MSSKDSDNRTERRVGDYVLVRRLGRGGMGKVYLARDVLLDRLVALKVLNGSFASDPNLVKRFRREAKAAAQLNHPNIVRVYAVREEKKVPYIAMEYVEGQTLEQRLAATGPMPWQQALDIARQVAEALACAHSNGIVHRDIKPGNVLIDAQGQVRVADFGLAKFVNATSGITSDGSFLGTPQYMSPDHCGEGEISAASDVFSLGVMLYEMLSGQRPFTGETPMMLVRQISMDPVSPLEDLAPNLPQSVYDLVANLLEKDAKRRLASGPELLGAIKNILALKHVDFPESTQFRSKSRIARPLGRFIGLGKQYWKHAAIASLVAIALVLVLGRVGKARQDRSNAESTQQSSGSPSLTSAAFTELGATQVSGRFPELGASLHPVDWVGSSLIAFGMETRREDRSERIVLGAVRPDNRTMQTLASFAPAPGWKVLNRAAPEFTIPRVLETSPLFGGILVVLPARDPVSGTYYQEVVIAKQGSKELEREVLFRADPMGAFAGNPEYFAGGCFGAIAHPNGESIGLILSRGAPHREMFLAESRLGASSIAQLSHPIVDDASPIMGATYAPDGHNLAYVRLSELSMDRLRKGTNKRLRETAGRADRQRAFPPLRELIAGQAGDRLPAELWVTTLGDNASARQLVAANSPDIDVAFSPDGKTLLASCSTSEKAAPELFLYTLDAGAAFVKLGSGRISRSPWHPSGRYFLASTRGIGGKARIEAVFPTGDARRILVGDSFSPAAADTLPAPCVSTDGRWAAVQSSEDHVPSLLFIDLEKAMSQ